MNSVQDQGGTQSAWMAFKSPKGSAGYRVGWARCRQKQAWQVLGSLVGTGGLPPHSRARLRPLQIPPNCSSRAGSLSLTPAGLLRPRVEGGFTWAWTVPTPSFSGKPSNMAAPCVSSTSFLVLCEAGPAFTAPWCVAPSCKQSLTPRPQNNEAAPRQPPNCTHTSAISCVFSCAYQTSP